MTPHKIITINGRRYDAVTGMLVESSAGDAGKASKPAAGAQAGPRPKPASTLRPAATSVHAAPQRSSTLNRRFAKKPTAVTAKASTPAAHRPGTGRHMDIAKSASVSRFAPHVAPHATAQPTVTAPKSPTPRTKDAPAIMHPSVQRALTKQAAHRPVAPQRPATPQETKQAALAASMATATAKPASKKPLGRPWYARARVLITIVLVAALLVAGGYAAYRFIPTISVSIAAAQAGMSATYPKYIPDGYSLSQPVNYSDGQISLHFASTSNSEAYTITQKRSSWDSSSVLDNLVKPKAGDNYSTTKERGLTIYTYKNDAYWVNGGILYLIEGNAALSGDQIRHIATSL